MFNRIVIIGAWAFRINDVRMIEAARVEETQCGLSITGPWETTDGLAQGITGGELDTIAIKIKDLMFQIPDSRMMELPTSKIENEKRKVLGVA